MKVISREEVFALLPVEACIKAMREAFFKLAQNVSMQYLRVAEKLPGGNILGLMPAYYDDVYCGAKVITVFHGNTGTRYPSHQGSVLLFDSRNGELLAAVDANAITQIRTGAVSAIATDLLARPDAKHAAFLGAGAQARSHLAALRLVRPLESITVYDANAGYAESFAEQARAQYGLAAAAVSIPAEAVRYADIICTLTPSKTPLIRKADVIPGAHVNAVGACTPDARELSTDLVAASRFFGDNRESVFHEAGDFLIPRAEKAIGDAHFLGELGELLCCTVQGRISDIDITVFEALGLAVEDIAAAKYVYEQTL